MADPNVPAWLTPANLAAIREQPFPRVAGFPISVLQRILQRYPFDPEKGFPFTWVCVSTLSSRRRRAAAKLTVGDQIPYEYLGLFQQH